MAEPQWVEVKDALAEIEAEHDQAIGEFPPFHSAHEGFAVLLEEVEELKAEVFRRQSSRSQYQMRKEAAQVGAMALRFIVDCCEPEERER